MKPRRLSPKEIVMKNKKNTSSMRQTQIPLQQLSSTSQDSNFKQARRDYCLIKNDKSKQAGKITFKLTNPIHSINLKPISIQFFRKVTISATVCKEWNCEIIIKQ
jgi:hypothetical protein